MPAVNLQDGTSVIIATRRELSERSVRAISDAFMSAGAAAAKLVELGFDEMKPETWSAWSMVPEENKDDVRGYQATLILHMVKSWSKGELPNAESVLDLPSETFQELSNLCGIEFNNVQSFSPDGVTDPKAPTES